MLLVLYRNSVATNSKNVILPILLRHKKRSTFKLSKNKHTHKSLPNSNTLGKKKKKCFRNE